MEILGDPLRNQKKLRRESLMRKMQTEGSPLDTWVAFLLICTFLSSGLDQEVHSAQVHQSHVLTVDFFTVHFPTRP